MRYLAYLALAAATLAAHASTITGGLSIAGIDHFTSSVVTFPSPGVVLQATGSLSVLPTLSPVTVVNIPLTPPGAEVGQTLFAATDVSAVVTGFTEVSLSGHFLNVLGTVLLSETGFSTTPYHFSLTSTQPDGIASYTLDLAPALSTSPVGEPSTLSLLGLGLTMAYLVYARRKFYGRNTVRQAEVTGDQTSGGLT